MNYLSSIQSEFHNLLWTVYAIISFRLLLSLLKRFLTPGVEMCKGHTSPLGATIARETWRTLQQRGGLTWWWPKPILFVSRFLKTLTIDLWKISRGFQQQIWKKGYTVYGRKVFTYIYIYINIYILLILYNLYMFDYCHYLAAEAFGRV